MNVGIILDTTDNNQEAFLSIINGNELNLKDSKNNVSLFFRNISNICTKFAGVIATLEKCYHTECDLIATSIDLADYMLKTFNKRKRILYLSEIEWLHGKNDYAYNCQILINPNLDIVVPSKEYDDELFNYCGKRAKLISSFNLERIINEVC